MVIIFTIHFIGCTSNIYIHKPSARLNTEFIDKDKFPLRVAIVLPPSMCSYEYKTVTGLSRFIFPMGEALCEGCKMVAETAFVETTVTSDKDSVSVEKIDLTLIPEVISTHALIQSTAGGPTEITLILQWRVVDPSGELIWIDTIESRAKGRYGSAFVFRKNYQQLMETTLMRFFDKSAQSILNSQEISKLAASKK